jgi:aspartyl-tRNA(Asn)/glutamyl-tRNA(Gln) amidotransferase subunit B
MPCTHFPLSIQNLNSIRSVERAVAHEEQRLSTIQLEANETRSFDVKSGRTVALRDKESVIDYRFLVDADLPPLFVPAELVSEFLFFRIPVVCHLISPQLF